MWLQPTPVGFVGLTLAQWLCIASVLWFGYQLMLNRIDKPCVCDVLSRLGRQEVER